MQTDYVKAWSNPVQNVYPGSNAVPYAVPQWLNDDREQDAAIKVKALSRWNNYYVEGLRQLIVDTEYDGIYLDEIACVCIPGTPHDPRCSQTDRESTPFLLSFIHNIQHVWFL